MTSSPVRTYYGTPVVKEPEWTWEVPWYLFVGGLGGASSVMAAVARRAGHDALADRAGLVAAGTAIASPALLIADLGRPSRFLNMLRVFKPTSAMSVGSWILAAYGALATGTGALRVLGWFPGLQRLVEGAAAVLGLPMATYTAVLMADSSIPVWHEARGELPFAFSGSAAASAGAAGILLAAAEDAGPARRLAVAGAAVELGAMQVMEQRLGELAEVYEVGPAGAFDKAAKGCTAAGAALVALGGAGRKGARRLASFAGAGLLLAGSICHRWSVYKAGFQSAADPRYVVKPQRERLDAGRGARPPA
jgi:formate-dependent nitrite reductase membrane component NrfD